MKTPTRLLISLGAVAFSFPLLAADPAAPGALRDVQAPSHKLERHVTMRHGGPGPLEREKVAFLGVETGRITPALTAQLALPRSIGLVVREVVPESPAAPVLQQHDILLKLDDQWLVEARQFAVLIRNHAAGDEVTLTYIRAGKQTMAKVKLTEHEVPKLAFDVGAGAVDHLEPFTDGPLPESGIRHVLPLLNHAGAPDVDAEVAATPALRGTAFGTQTSNMVFNDEHGVMELTVRQGKKSLVARNEKGEQIFSGPIDTPAEREKLPDDLKQRLEQIQSMEHFRFEFGPGFEENLRFARPQPIVLPLPDDDREPESAAF